MSGISTGKELRKDSTAMGDYTLVGRNGVSSIQDLGTALRERREAMGVSLAEVESATRIRMKYLAALESEEWHLLPGEVVGRGFLRNYAEYLGIEPNEVIERRRAVVDTNLTAALSNTSAGAPLPPERAVDYRPKEVDLKDDADEIEPGQIRLAPILTVLVMGGLVFLGWWSVTNYGDLLNELFATAQTRVAQILDRPDPTATPKVLSIVNPANEGIDQSQRDQQAPVAPVAAAPDAGAGSSGIDGPVSNSAEQTPTQDLASILIPTATPAPPTPTVAPALPTDTPLPTHTPAPPTPLPTDTPLPLPTDTPALPTDTPPPPPPVAAAAACGDGRALISSPGVGQVVSGILDIGGSATHDNFASYKLEYAAGANAASGFVYFYGLTSQVAGGVLGSLDTTLLPNGEYTIRITVVDQTGNYPPPCDINIVIQN
jgi:cytoskeletal protein RodZ